MKIELRKEKIISGILIFLCGIYGMLCAFLYYNQSLFYTTGVYESDLAAHISMAVNDHWYYSFTAYVYDFLSHFHEGNLYIGIFFAVMTVGTIYGTYLLFLELFQVLFVDAHLDLFLHFSLLPQRDLHVQIRLSLVFASH